MSTLYEKVLHKVKQRRERALSGKVNCIPSPFVRFRRDFVGLEKGTFAIVTSFTKGGKSQFTSYTFIYEPLLYTYYNDTDISIKYLYFSLEEAPEKILERFMSYLLYKFTKGKMRISPSQIRSVDKDNPLPKEALDIMETDEFKDLVSYFEDHVIFMSEANPTGIYKACRSYAEKVGKVYTKTGNYKDEHGRTLETQVFDRYEPDNPNEYVIPIVDTINIIETESGMNIKQSIDKLCLYAAKYLRNRYQMSPIFIQQQSFESENNESFKLNRLRPSVHNLGDSKYSSRDANLVLGLFSPARFGIGNFFGYDINRLKDHARFLELCINRDGEMGGIVGLFFDGATCNFSELPLPSNKEAMERVYRYAERLDSVETVKGTNFLIYGIQKLLSKL